MTLPAIIHLLWLLYSSIVNLFVLLAALTFYVSRYFPFLTACIYSVTLCWVIPADWVESHCQHVLRAHSADPIQLDHLSLPDCLSLKVCHRKHYHSLFVWSPADLSLLPTLLHQLQLPVWLNHNLIAYHSAGGLRVRCHTFFLIRYTQTLHYTPQISASFTSTPFFIDTWKKKLFWEFSTNITRLNRKTGTKNL